MAAALLHHPEFLILDEPTTGLDPQQLVEIRKLIKTIGKTTTVFLSTHIMQEVEALCDRVLILHHGKIVLDSPLTALAANQQQVIKVSFDYRVETEALTRIPKVERVINIFDFDYEIYCSTDADMRPAIFDFAHDNNLKIRNLQHKIEEVFNEIQRSNMSKLGANGEPIYRQDGKVMKGPNYFKPDIRSILES